MSNAKIAVLTAQTPYLVTRRLRAITPARLGRRERHVMAWIEQAATLIEMLSIERQRLILAANNYSKAKCRVVRIERSKVKSAPKVKQEPRIGKVVRSGPNQAEQVADLIVATVDLYRMANGSIRVVKAGGRVKGCEFLGRFDEGATWQDIKEAIE